MDLFGLYFQVTLHHQERSEQELKAEATETCSLLAH